jgi:pyruvate formate lyase activating enzyme
MRGRVHSFETLGALDGPGLRAVVFLQGCPRRCLYCQNPDTWDPRGGEAWEADAVVARVARCRPYFARAGGVTLSGGEPLVQPAFAAAILAGCRRLGIHTALDTSGACPDPDVRAVLACTDLVILDLKHADPERHRALTGGDLAPIVAFLDAVTDLGLALWVRQVIVPGWNDLEADLDALASLLRCRARPRLQRVELLPYHTLARPKWEALGLPYPLAETPAPAPERLADLQRYLDARVGRQKV